MAGSSSSPISGNVDFVDEFYFSALFDDGELFPISDEKYAEELQLQEALMVSSSASGTGTCSSGPSSPSLMSTVNVVVGGQSSERFCDICMDTKPESDMFGTTTCSHSFCTDCISKYVAAKIQEGVINLTCPDLKCQVTIGPELCRAIVPKQVLDRWEDALCESLILASQKFYCPFKDCSAMMVDDGGGLVTESECPDCRRLFCAQCKVAWHAGIRCEQFRSLREDEREREDIMLMELAEEKKWRRCSKCSFFVEKKEGCHHITCRCGHEFCYECGSDYRAHGCQHV